MLAKAYIVVLWSTFVLATEYHIVNSQHESSDFVRNKRQALNSSELDQSSTKIPSSPSSTKPPSTTFPSTLAANTSKTTLPTTSVFPSTTAKKISTVSDQHAFYTTQLFDSFDRFWIELYFGNLKSNIANNVSNVVRGVTHEKLSVSYRTAAVIDLKFTFPFYGHPVKRVVIATGGFVYVGEVLNPRLLTFSQFIAPLMANFDFTISQADHLIYFSNSSMLIVEWRDVVLQENPSRPFCFQLQIHSSGRIIFAYKEIPVNIHDISQTKHPVEISLSDAYSSERKDLVTGTTFQTLHAYSETKVPPEWVKSRSVVVLTPLPTCVELTSCSRCLSPSPDLAFNCAWCPSTQRCSFGFDRGRKTWLRAKCHLKNVTEASVCMQLPPEQRIGVNPFTSSWRVSRRRNMELPRHSSAVGAWIVLVILIVIAILTAVGLCIGWLVYAHRNPGSRAGIWLVEHRPSRLWTDITDSFRHGISSIRNFFTTSKSYPNQSTHSSSNQNHVVAYNGSNGHSGANNYDVSVGGVTLSASRI